LNHKNYATKIAETMIFDKSGGCTGAGLRYIHNSEEESQRLRDGRDGSRFRCWGIAAQL